MAGFEKQGLNAASCEPFFEWCEESGVDLRISAVTAASGQQSYGEWNEILKLTAQGDLDTADKLLEDFSNS